MNLETEAVVFVIGHYAQCFPVRAYIPLVPDSPWRCVCIPVCSSSSLWRMSSKVTMNILWLTKRRGGSSYQYVAPIDSQRVALNWFKLCCWRFRPSKVLFWFHALFELNSDSSFSWIALFHVCCQGDSRPFVVKRFTNMRLPSLVVCPSIRGSSTRQARPTTSLFCAIYDDWISGLPYWYHLWSFRRSLRNSGLQRTLRERLPGVHWLHQHQVRATSNDYIKPS